MLMHVDVSEVDTFPAQCLCGKVKKRKSLIPLPLACIRCTRRLIDIGNQYLEKESKPDEAV